MAKDKKQILKEQFEVAVNDYLNAFLGQFELDGHNGWWVGDEVGGLYINGDLYYVTFEEMRYIVDNDIAEETYLEWYDYCDKCNAFELKPPTLKAYCQGCPRVSEDEWKHLESQKSKLDNEIQRIVDEYWNPNNNKKF